MTGYDGDSRVQRVTAYLLFVEAPDDRYSVSANRDRHDWWVGPVIGGVSYRAAHLRSRDDADVWAARVARGPFRTADEAIASLIGDQTTDQEIEEATA